MKPRQILHLVRFDLRALRLPAVLWLAILAAEAVQFYLGPSASKSVNEFERTANEYGFGILRIAFTFIFTALLVHKDPVVGTTPFWMARPVHRAILLLSKVCSGGILFVAMPSAVLAITLAALGVDVPHSLLGAWSVAQFQLAVFIVAMAVASVTASLLHFVIGGLGALAVTSLFGSVIGPWCKTTWRTFLILIPESQWPWLAPIGLAMLVVVIVYQYLTQRTWRAAGGLVCLAAIGALFFSVASIQYDYMLSPFQFTRGAGMASDRVIAPSAVTLAVDSSTQVQEEYSILEKTKGIRVTMRYSVADLPPAVSVDPTYVESEIELPDGTRQAWQTESVFPRSVRKVASSGVDRLYSAISTALDVDKMATVGESIYERRLCVAAVPTDTFNRFKGQTVRVRGTVYFRAYRYVLKRAIPLKAGGTIQIAGFAERLEGVRVEAPLLTITLRRTMVDFDYLRRIGVFTALRNPTRREAIFSSSDRRYAYKSLLGTGRPTILTERWEETRGMNSLPIRGVIVDAAWLAGAEWISGEIEFLGYVARPLKIDDFVLGATTDEERK